MGWMRSSLPSQEVHGCTLLAEVQLSSLFLGENVKQKWRNMGECRIRDDWACKHFRNPRKLTCKHAYITKGIAKGTLWKRGNRRKQTHSLKLNLSVGGEMTEALTPLMQAWWTRHACTCAFRVPHTPTQMTSLLLSWIASALGIFRCCALGRTGRNEAYLAGPVGFSRTEQVGSCECRTQTAFSEMIFSETVLFYWGLTRVI